MKMHRFLSSMVLLAGLHLCALSQQQSTPQQTRKLSVGERHYLNAKRLITNNCIDCMGSTKAGMEQGIQEMQAALDTGFTKKKAAYKLLADGYNAMITFSGNDEKERENFEQKESEALGEVYRLDPLDSEFAVRYADTVKDNQEKLSILKNVAERDPKQADAAFGAGFLLIDRGESGEGLKLVSQAIANQKDPEAVANYAQRTLGLLQEKNCPFADADAWNQKFGDAADKATRGEGDPKPMLEVKKQFSEKLDKHTCKTNP
jgi:hypothetical protein